MGKIKKILENELIGGTQSTEIYPVTSTKAVYNSKNKNLDEVLHDISNVINVDTIAPLASGYYTANTARNAVPTTYRVLGLIITYKTSATTSVTEQYTGSSVSGWATDSNWTNVGSGGGNVILNWNTDIATTRKQVQLRDRKEGLVVTFKNENQEWVTQQYTYSNVSDAFWILDDNWVDEIKEKDIINSEIKGIIESVEDYPNDYTVVGGSSTSAVSIAKIDVFSGQYVYFKIKRKEGVNTKTSFYVGAYNKSLKFNEDNIAEGYIKIINGGNLHAQLFQKGNSDRGVYSFLSFKYKYASTSAAQNSLNLSNIKTSLISNKTNEIEKVLPDAVFNKTTTSTTAPGLFGLIDVVGGDMYINFKLLEGNENLKSIDVYIQTEAGININRYTSSLISEDEKQIIIPESDLSGYEKVKAFLYLYAGTYNFSCTLLYGSIGSSTEEAIRKVDTLEKVVSTISDSNMYEPRNPLYYYQHVITISADKDDEDADFKGVQSIWEALESIQDASPTNRYCIYVKPGLYKITSKDEFHPYPGNYYTYFYTKQYVDIIGSDPKSCIFESSVSETINNRYLYQTLYSGSRATIKNISVIAHDIRYAIHRDGGNEFLRAENCIVRTCNSTIGGFNGNAWGTGTHDGEITEITGGESISDTAIPISIHTNSEFKYPSGYRIKNHRMINTYIGDSALNMVELGSGVCNFVDMQGCGFGINKLITWEAELYSTERNPLGSKGCIVNCANFRLYGFGNDKFLFKTLSRVLGLKIESLTKSKDSKVEFKGGTASGLVYSHYINNNTIIPDEEYDNRGFIYKLGANSIPAYAIGMVPSNFWNEILGDCSSVSKNLIIGIDGTDYTINFDKNYTADSNITATVVDTINRVISAVGVASTKAYSADYFAECTDVLGIYCNNFTEEDKSILKGRAVVIDSYGVRLATDNDSEILGVSIDDISPRVTYSVGDKQILKGFGRIVYNTYLRLSDSASIPCGFAYCATPLSQINFGDKLRINSLGEFEKNDNGTFIVKNINNNKVIEL